MDQLGPLAALLRVRSAVDREIAQIIRRPVHSGHFGEYVASIVFGIELNPDATTKAHDGQFIGGSLAGKTVNVKYRTRHRGLLNLGTSMNPDDHPDFYLVLSGPKIAMGTTVETTAPLSIDVVYLFETRQLLHELKVRGVQPGIARSVQQTLWEAAMIYPVANNPWLRPSESQRNALALFADVSV